MPPDQATSRYFMGPIINESIRNKIEEAKKLVSLKASYSSRGAACQHVADQLLLKGFQYPRISKREKDSKWSFRGKFIDALSEEGMIVIRPQLRHHNIQPDAKRPAHSSSTTVATTLRPTASLSPTFLRCSGCRVPRAIKRFAEESGLCRYCHVGGSNKLLEEKFCIEGAHEEARSDFIDSNDEEHDACLHCKPKIGQNHANTKDSHNLDSSTAGSEWIEMGPYPEPPRKKQKRDSEHPEFQGDETDWREQIVIDETSDDDALEAIKDDAKLGMASRDSCSGQK
ncbi:uncharacterized protein J3D65DRAFT_676954 [Phyllosticta citribraziliensis]|uniref:Uncharacterized protein n=1 Tax=Phyllosticta citribraziliensis TaxID=989973 RepID=A0ABR1LP01_9PEZI